MLRDSSKALAARVRRSAAKLTGTPPYWAARSRELSAMIRQIGTQHAFVTHSAADIQWPDLHVHMPHQPPPGASEPERQRFRHKSINENPALAAWWFQRRWTLWLNSVLKPLYKITDWWYRFEWQHRGSSHVHALFWMRGAPSPDELDLQNPVSVAAFEPFWSSRAMAVNPGLDVPPSAEHPSAMRADNLTFTFKDLAQLLNRVQRHTRCNTSYCLRRAKGSDANAPMVCRFKFPQEIATPSE